MRNERSELFHRAVDLINDERVNEWGPLHIVVSDGNIEDHWITECEMQDGLSEQEVEFLKVMRELSEDDRFLVWEHRK